MTTSPTPTTASPASPAPGAAPGDEAPAGTPGTGEKPCPVCGGSGQLSQGRTCPNCQGAGKVVAGIGGG